MRRFSLYKVVSLLVASSVVAQTASAQRFEGIITMKLSGGIAAVVGGRGAGATANGAAGRGAEGRSRAAEGRGASGRAGAAGAPGGRGAATVEGRAAEPRTPDPREETMRNALAGGLQQIEYMTRRGKIRIAVSGVNGQPSPAAMIYVPEDGLMFTLLPPVSMYSETRMSDVQSAMTAAGSDTSSATPRVAVRAPTVTHTKQFELVAGHKCERIVVTAGTQKSEICMGKGLGVFVMPAGFGRAEGWDRVMAESNGFPLRVKQANGTVTMEVVKIERKALPESLFSVPDSYTKMPDLMRGRPPG